MALLAGAVSAIEVPGTAGRIDAGGYVDGLAIVKTQSSPRQRPQGLANLRLDALARDWLRGHLELRGRIGGPFEGGHADVYNFVHTFQNYSPAGELSEAYADLRFQRADVRIGVQKAAWGKLDGVPPTDVLNPRDYHDPLVQDFEEAKIGVPAVLGSYYLPDLPRAALSQLRATLVYVPIAVPSRLPLLAERWFPPTIADVSQLTVSRELQMQAGLDFGRDITIPVAFDTANHRTPVSFDTGGIAFRLGGTWHETDWDIYHYTGPETGPDVDLLAEVALDASTPEHPIQAQAVLRQAHDVIHMTGFDWSAAFGPASVRAEAAFFQGHSYLRAAEDLVSEEALAELPLETIGDELRQNGRAAVPLGDLFVPLDSVEWGIGVDCLVRGFLPLLQLNQTVLLERAPRLLISDPETRLTGVLRRSFMQERLELELRSAYAIERESWMVFPRVSYLLRDDLRVRLGYLALGGPTVSMIGQYRNNDEVVIQARYSF